MAERQLRLGSSAGAMVVSIGRLGRLDEASHRKETKPVAVV